MAISDIPDFYDKCIIFSLKKISCRCIYVYNSKKTRPLENSVGIDLGIKNKCLSKSITEQQWGKIKKQLTYKTESVGGKLVLVNPHSSQVYSQCEKINPKIPLSQRVFNCIYCDYYENRDIISISLMKETLYRVGQLIIINSRWVLRA